MSVFVRLPRAQPIETSIEATGRLPIKNLKKTADKFNKRNIKYVRAWFPLSNNVNSVYCVLILFDQKFLVLRRQYRTGAAFKEPCWATSRGSLGVRLLMFIVEAADMLRNTWRVPFMLDVSIVSTADEMVILVHRLDLLERHLFMVIATPCGLIYQKLD